MNIDRITFWQPFASPHQEAFLEAVAEQFPGEVLLAVERPELPSDRVAQGWRQPVHHRVRVIDISQPANHATVTSYRGQESLHVFTGFFSHPLVWSGFYKLAPSRAKLAIYSEAPEQPWHTGWLKRLRGRWLAARYAKRFAFVLAIGHVGCSFFARIGFPKESIVPFGYYLANLPLPVDKVRPPGGIVRFIFAGQLTWRKGVDVLIEACVALPKSGWRLDIFGAGPERARLERQVADRGLASFITFHGPIPNPDVQVALATADCAVLPSRFDGWGMLVNEALAAGTPVLCSDACGAASIVKEHHRVFHSGNVAELASLMTFFIPSPGARSFSKPSVCHALTLPPSASVAGEKFLARVSVA